jgi:hypothetical protein
MLREMVISRNIWKIPDRYAVCSADMRRILRGWKKSCVESGISAGFSARFAELRKILRGKDLIRKLFCSFARFSARSHDFRLVRKIFGSFL